MKQYRLKKDLPTVKAGTLFRVTYDASTNEESTLWAMEVNRSGSKLYKQDIIDFKNWFEEVNPDAIKAEEFAKKIHETRELLAPKYGYETKGVKAFDPKSIDGQLMIATYNKILQNYKQKTEYDIALQTLKDSANGYKFKAGEKNYFIVSIGAGIFSIRSAVSEPIPGVIYFDKKGAKNSLANHKKEWEIITNTTE